MEELFENLSLSPGNNWQVWVLIHSLFYDFSWTLKCVVLCYGPLPGGERLRPSWGGWGLQMYGWEKRGLLDLSCAWNISICDFSQWEEKKYFKLTENVCGTGRQIYSTYMVLNKNIQCREQSLKINAFFIKHLLGYIKT